MATTDRLTAREDVSAGNAHARTMSFRLPRCAFVLLSRSDGACGNTAAWAKLCIVASGRRLARVSVRPQARSRHLREACEDYFGPNLFQQVYSLMRTPEGAANPNAVVALVGAQKMGFVSKVGLLIRTEDLMRTGA